MLNDEQKEVLLSILAKSLNALRRQPPTLSINVLSILESNSTVNINPFLSGGPPPLNKHIELQFREAGVLDTFNFLQRIFYHPYPQNRTTGNMYVEQEKGMAVFKDEFGKIAKEPVGLLGLTLYNDPLQPIDSPNNVSRDDVFTIARSVIVTALDSEKQRLLNLVMLSKSIGEPRDRATEQLEAYKRQVAMQQLELVSRAQLDNGQQPSNKKHKRSVIELDTNNGGTRPITREMYQLIKSTCSIDLDLDQQGFASLNSVGTPALSQFNRLTISFAQVADLLVTIEQIREAKEFFDMLLLEYDLQRAGHQVPRVFDDLHRKQIMNALLCRSHLLHRLKEFTNAHRDMDLFNRMNTDSDACTLLSEHFRAMIFEAQGYYKQAFETYSKAIETRGADQRFAHALFKRAVLRAHHFRDVQGAVEDYTNAIRTLPEYAQAYFNRGRLYHFYNVTGLAKDSHALPSDIVLALMNYDMSIALDPKNITALNSRGVLHMSRFKNSENALADFEAVLHIAPKNSNAYCNRGTLYYKHLMDRERALVDYDTAIEFDPKNVSAYYNRGLLFHEVMNQPLRALDDYNMVETLDPLNVHMLEARARLFRDRFNDMNNYQRDMQKLNSIT